MSGKKQALLCGIKKCMFIAFNMILTMEIPLDQLISGFLAKMQLKSHILPSLQLTMLTVINTHHKAFSRVVEVETF